MEVSTRHQCMIYEGPPSGQMPGLARLMINQLQAGKRCLYMNNPALVATMRACLAAAGLDVERNLSRGSLVLSSDTGYMVNGSFDPGQMLRMISDAVHAAVADGYSGLWASGDMTWEFGNEANFEKLMEYEWRLEQMCQTLPALSGVCQYHQDSLPEGTLHAALSVHKTVYINQALSRINPFQSTIGEPPITQGLSTSQIKDMIAQLSLSAG